MITLHGFVKGQLSPDALMSDPARLEFCREQLKAGKKRLTRQLLVTNSIPVGATERWAVVQAIQLDVTRLLDTLYFFRLSRQSAAGSSANGDVLISFYVEAAALFHDVLIALEQHFADCLAGELLLPHSYVTVARRQLAVRLRELEVLLYKPDADEALAEVLLRPVREFLLHTNGRADFRTLTYLRDLVSGLYITGTFDPADTDRSHRALHTMLIHLNFNAIEYYLYCISWLRAYMAARHQLPGRIVFLTWCIRELKGLPAKRTGAGLYPACSTIASQLLGWLTEERTFLRSLLKETLQYEINHPNYLKKTT